MMRSAITVACLAAMLVASFAEYPGARVDEGRTQLTSVSPSYPEAVITNGQIQARLALPDVDRGFYRSTRFDWSGIITSLEYQGHRYYGPWFTASEPPVRDFIYRDADIVAGAQSSVMGPAEEFSQPQGFDTAKAGETFVKIGVGVLRKPDGGNYSAFASYELVDHGTWSVRTARDAVAFEQTVNDSVSGYGYIYGKSVQLMSGRPEMTITHSLRNTGRLRLDSRQYNHNFLVLDGAPIGADMAITLPFPIQTTQPLDPALATIHGREIAYLKTLEGRDRVTASITGFGSESGDYDLRIENRKTGAGLRITSDRPMASLSLWSIRSVLAMEPFVDVSTEPGQTTTWTFTYAYFVNQR
jgi:hypothetical protein